MGSLKSFGPGPLDFLGMICAVYRLDRDKVVEIISRKFGGKSRPELAG